MGFNEVFDEIQVARFGGVKQGFSAWQCPGMSAPSIPIFGAGQSHRFVPAFLTDGRAQMTQGGEGSAGLTTFPSSQDSPERPPAAMNAKTTEG